MRVVATCVLLLTLVLPSSAGAVVIADSAGLITAPRPYQMRTYDPVTVIRTTGSLTESLLARTGGLRGATGVVAVDSETHRLMDTSVGVGWAPGFGIAFDVYGVNPTEYVALVPQAGVLTDLGEQQIVLSRTAARQRGLGVGDWILLDNGLRLEVVGTVDDRLIDGAGGVVTRTTLGGRTRYALVGHQRGSTVPEQVEALVADVPRTLSRDLGPPPWSTGWRTVAALTALEDALGPLPYRAGAGRSIITDGRADIVRAQVPIIGDVSCNVAVIEPLRAALATLESAGLSSLIDPGDYAGCHAPRLIGSGGPLSRHAFGIAVDINATTNGFGADPTMDPRVVEAFESAGFVWGGRWPVPDGMHFEWHP